MAVTATHIIDESTTTDATSYVMTSWTPVANRLYLVGIHSAVASDTPNVPTISGANGLTFVQVATSVDSTRRLTVFRAMKASGLSAGTATVDFGGQTQGGYQASVDEFDGVDTGGTDGSAAIVQSAAATPLTGTSISVTLSAFGSVDNATYGFGGGSASTTILDAGTGFTALAERSSGSPSRVMLAEWRSDNDTTPEITATSSTNLNLIGAEIKATAAGGPTPVRDVWGAMPI